MERYFDKLPNVYYANTLVKDISRRATLVENEKRSPYNFYPYDLKHQLRSDQIAEYYYGDSRLDWFIYLSNGIVDPYYDWYLSNDQLETLLIQKYGSVEQSIKKVAFYRNNWATDPNELEPSVYTNVIPESWRKYYKPNWGLGTRVMSYSRKEDDTVTNTNRILQYTISANNNSLALSDGELIDIKVPGLDATSGTAEVLFSNSTVIRVLHVNGNTSANTTHTKTIVGETTSANLTVNGVTTLAENFDETESVFWSPVTYYDYEVELNEAKKTIRLVEAGNHQLLIQEFTRKINDGVDIDTNLSIE